MAVIPTKRPITTTGLATVQNNSIPKARPIVNQAAANSMKQNGFVLGTDMNTLNSQLAHAQAQQSQYQKAGKKSPGWDARISTINNAIGKLNAPTQGIAPVAPGGPGSGDGTKITYGQDGVVGSTSANNGTDAFTKMIYPSASGSVLENYQSSPLYKWQAGEGGKALDQYYAARGLTNSGVEDAGRTKFLNQLGAEESNRAMGYAQTEADRAVGLATDNANRQDQQGRDQWGRINDLLGFATANNPANNAAKMTGSAAETTISNSNDLAKLLASIYNKPSIGAGGGGAKVPFVPKFPSAPNTSQLNGVNAVTNSANNNAFMSLISNLASGLLSMGK